VPDPEVLPPLSEEESKAVEAQRQAPVPQEGKRVNLNPGQMLQVAVENNAPVETLEKLMDLRDRWESKEAEKAFVVALNEFKADPPEIFKNKRVGFETRGEGGDVSYSHATLDHISSTVGKALSKHGIAHRWDVDQGAEGKPDSVKITVTCILTHKKGHSEKVSIEGWPDDSGKKNKIQQIASTITYLQRYTILAATGLAPAEMGDDDGRGSELTYVDEEQKAQLVEAMCELGCDVYPDRHKAVLDFLKIESLDELEKSRFDDALTAIVDRRKRMEERAGREDT